MNEFEKMKLEVDLKNFTSRNFEAPVECRNEYQIRFYLSELSDKIKEYETQFKYVPAWAYALLAQYNIAHSQFIQKRSEKIL